MRPHLHLREGSRVFIDLRATGLLKAVAHSPTLTARPERVVIELTGPGGGDVAATASPGGAGPGGGAIEASGGAAPGGVVIVAVVEATFAATAIEAPVDIPASDREKMVDNLRGRDVLDAARFPAIAFRGRYEGTLEAGTLSGELQVRATVRRVSMPVRISREAAVLVATGAWEGRLTNLGIRPFKALLGAIKLQDWIAIRLDARFDAPLP